MCLIKTNEIELDSTPDEITMTAMVSGEAFWQHAQLFRQAMDDTSDMMVIDIQFWFNTLTASSENLSTLQFTGVCKFIAIPLHY